MSMTATVALNSLAGGIVVLLALCSRDGLGLRANGETGTTCEPGGP